MSFSRSTLSQDEQRKCKDYFTCLNLVCLASQKGLNKFPLRQSLVSWLCLETIFGQFTYRKH